MDFLRSSSILPAVVFCLFGLEACGRPASGLRFQVSFTSEQPRDTLNGRLPLMISGDRADYCWNGDHTRPNPFSRLRYHQMHAPKNVKRILKSAPPGVNLRSWRY